MKLARATMFVSVIRCSNVLGLIIAQSDQAIETINMT